MALIKTTIQNQITSILDATENLDTEQGKTQFASLLADAIIAAIRSATITIPSGAINTVGGPAAQSNVVPVVVVGGLS